MKFNSEFEFSYADFLSVISLKTIFSKSLK